MSPAGAIKKTWFIELSAHFGLYGQQVIFEVIFREATYRSHTGDTKSEPFNPSVTPFFRPESDEKFKDAINMLI